MPRSAATSTRVVASQRDGAVPEAERARHAVDDGGEHLARIGRRLQSLAESRQRGVGVGAVAVDEPMDASLQHFPQWLEPHCDERRGDDARDAANADELVDREEDGEIPRDHAAP